MKAIVVAEPGGPEKLELREVPDPELCEGQLLIDVKATALNRADLLQRRGLYPPPKGETDILGLECAGVVAALGPGTTGSVGVGQRVMALLGGGGYAEKVVIPERMAILIPERLDFEAAAAIPEAFLTAREALVTLGRTSAESWVLVHAAAGGVGSAAVQLARRLGARVVATAGDDAKLARVRELGANVVVNYKTDDFSKVAREASGAGVDVVVDFVGGAYWEKHAACMAVGARCVVVGVLGGTHANVNLAQLLRQRLQILGLVMRSRPLSDKIAITAAFIREDLPGIADGTLAPIIDSVLPLAEARAAHERMEQNLNVGKLVLRVA